MQDWADCSSSDLEKSFILTDSRDNSKYTITKLKDNQCWMTQNLRIVGKNINQNDSDINGSFSIPASSYWTDGSNTAKHVHYTGNTTNGAYYTWSAATAGSGDTAYSRGGGTAEYSICPKGWRLPKDSDYNNIISLYGITNSAAGFAIITASPLNFAKNGVFYYMSNALDGVGTHGYYWTSTLPDATSSPYMLFFRDVRVMMARDSNDLNQASGQGLRCIKR